MGRPTKFTPEVRQQVLATLHAGGYVSSAAEAARISRYTLFHWLASKDEHFAGFQQAVRTARAEARLSGKVGMLRKNPKYWLLCGPGRETYNADGTVAHPGWAKPGRRETQRQNALDAELEARLRAESEEELPDAKLAVKEQCTLAGCRTSKSTQGVVDGGWVVAGERTLAACSTSKSTEGVVDGAWEVAGERTLAACSKSKSTEGVADGAWEVARERTLAASGTSKSTEGVVDGATIRSGYA